MLTRDNLIREYRSRSASWHTLAVVYGIIVGTLLLTAHAII